MAFKILHQFDVSIEKEVEEVVTKTENGQEITIKSKIKKVVPTTIVMKELSRREKQDLNVWYARNYNEAINIHGLSPRVFIVQKFLRDPSNPLSEDQDKNLAKMYDDLETAKNDYVRVNALTDDEFSKDKKARIIENFISLQRKVMDIETAYKSIFAHTAENYAQNKAITWLVLFLSFVVANPNTNEPIFPGKDYAEKEENLFNLEDTNDPLYLACVEKLSTFWGLYYFGQAGSKEEFVKIEQKLAEQLAAENAKAETSAPIAPDVPEPPTPADAAELVAPVVSAA